ncbi:hypothetical protein DCS_06875 [Drechmeria coniospora]|uniref:Uncharacterized protein n=1 Tax=Drechmeria coniospora TaxID=98403 RepID=A0A151GCZ2_DRECN|nr:hypothetical protein DCS_06875 [Drechmeria coniospora]KYK54914.1 hypothetical protein DCS_06875 [Drechmeria coniospora]
MAFSPAYGKPLPSIGPDSNRALEQPPAAGSSGHVEPKENRDPEVLMNHGGGIGPDDAGLGSTVVSGLGEETRTVTSDVHKPAVGNSANASSSPSNAIDSRAGSSVQGELASNNGMEASTATDGSNPDVSHTRGGSEGSSNSVSSANGQSGDASGDPICKGSELQCTSTVGGVTPFGCVLDETLGCVLSYEPFWSVSLDRTYHKDFAPLCAPYAQKCAAVGSSRPSICAWDTIYNCYMPRDVWRPLVAPNPSPTEGPGPSISAATPSPTDGPDPSIGAPSATGGNTDKDPARGGTATLTTTAIPRQTRAPGGSHDVYYRDGSRASTPCRLSDSTTPEDFTTGIARQHNGVHSALNRSVRPQLPC